MKLLKKTYTLSEAIKTLEHYCVYQERCHQEVKQKLERMHMIPQVIDTVIVHLIEHNFLNEERYAKAFVRGKFRIKFWGRNRLAFELKKKAISKININLAIKTIPEEEYVDVFNELTQKKIQVTRASNVFKKRKKVADYLLYRGWEADLVYKTVNKITL